jgi:Uma2 family endonuclease
MATEPEVVAPLREPPGPMTAEAFYEWCDEDTRAEWVDGEVIVLSPTSNRHHQIIRFLSIVIQAWVDARDLGQLFQEVFLIRLYTPARRERVPDLMFVRREHLDRVKPTYVDGLADLVVEIVSLDSVARDRGDKFYEYERAGIPEYWLIDPDRERAELYELDPDGRYRLALGGRTGIYRSTVLDSFPLDLEWLWQQPPPKPFDIAGKLEPF